MDNDTKIIISIGSGSKPASQEDKNQAYKQAVEQFANDKNDVDVDTLRKILKAISSLISIKEKDPDKNKENFNEQTEVATRANHLFE